MPQGDKTKRCHGVDLHSRCFAFVGSEDDTATWHLCVHVLGDPAKSINAVKNALGRFDQTRGIPDTEKQRAYDTVYGAALALGIPAERRTFAANVSAPAPAQVAEPKPPKVEAHKPLSDKKLNDLAALFDRQADLFLRQLGIE